MAIRQHIIKYLKNTNITSFSPHNLSSEKLYRDVFITEYSKHIPDKLLNNAVVYFEQNTKNYMCKLRLVTKNFKIIDKILISILEFTLVHVLVSGLDSAFILPVYEDKLDDICQNLDPKSRLNNSTLLPAIINKSIDPRIIAFLTPDQLHPASMQNILDKIKIRHDVENNMASTDLYKCTSCDGTQCKITELQLRSADEPTSRIITCLICYNTIII